MTLNFQCAYSNENEICSYCTTRGLNCGLKLLAYTDGIRDHIEALSQFCPPLLLQKVLNDVVLLEPHRTRLTSQLEAILQPQLELDLIHAGLTAYLEQAAPDCLEYTTMIMCSQNARTDSEATINKKVQEIARLFSRGNYAFSEGTALALVQSGQMEQELTG